MQQPNILGRQLASACFEMQQAGIVAPLSLCSHNSTILGDTDGEVIAQRSTGLPEREDIAAPVSHGDPLAACGNGSDPVHALFPDA